MMAPYVGTAILYSRHDSRILSTLLAWSVRVGQCWNTAPVKESTTANATYHKVQGFMLDQIFASHTFLVDVNF